MKKELLEKVTEMMKPHPVYLVGGAVRDYLMNNEPKDYDFSTPAEPDEIERLIKKDKRRAYLTGKKFGTLGCKVDGEMVEITTFRIEKYKPNNRKPDVEYVKSIHQDLSRRDFTINAMAIRLTKGYLRIIDPFCGQEDLERGVIRAVGHPKQRFKEDPLRILRAVRFACRFGFEIEENTEKKMKKMGIYLLDISKERWMMEMDKILLSEYVGQGLRLLWQNELFKFIIPELQLQFNYNQNSAYHNYDLHYHTHQVVVATPKDLDLRWSALLHDIAKPFVRTDKQILLDEHNVTTKSNYIGHEKLGADMVLRLASHLNWSNDRRDKVVELVRNHLDDDCPLREYDNMGKNKDENKEEKLLF